MLTLSSHNQTRHAVRDAGARGQEGDTHDVVRDVQRVADDGDLQHKAKQHPRYKPESCFKMASPAQCWREIYDRKTVAKLVMMS